MRILHVSEVHWGGVVSLLAEFTAEQVKGGHDVHVLAPPMDVTLAGSSHHWSLVRERPTTYARSLLELRRLVDDLAPDVIHLHSFIAGFFGRLPGPGVLRPSTAVVYQPHAWSFDLFQLRGVGTMIRWWERRASRRTDMLVANCQDEIDEGRSVGIDTPAEPLGVAVRTDQFVPVNVQQRTELRRQLGVSHRHVLLCVGRLARQKGQDQLVAAWEASPIPDAQLVLAGPGDASPLSNLAPSEWGRSITCIGENHQIATWMAASDLLVLPSRYETVAVVVAESLACGRPVIATDVNGVREALTDPPHPPAGAVVALGDMSALLGEAGKRLANRDLAEREGRAGRQRALALFEPEQVAHRLDSAYTKASGLATTRQSKEVRA